ncbi:NrdE [Staphylococcus phage VB-SauS-SA2]|nr:NrdE [Staphylococcus phage VB-SauS-SA2]
MTKEKTHIELNNEVLSPEGQLNIEKDKQAVKKYFVDYINMNMVWFHDLEEKINYLLDNDYYSYELFSKYDILDVKKVFKEAYSHKFRFPSYMSAKKFYDTYALKTHDGSKFLERYEDRMSVVALFFGDGDVEESIRYVNLLMTQQYVPATPTMLNAGLFKAGEMVSCFLLETGDSLNDINMMNSTARQLSKLGGGISINLSKTRAANEELMGNDNKTMGVVPIMKNLDQSSRHINQGGKRNGSFATYLNVFHADIFEFLDTKKISADEDVRVKTLSIGVVIPNKFFDLAKDNEPMYLFYPKNLWDTHGIYIDEIDMDEWYDTLINDPEVRKTKIDPRNLLERISITQIESGYPYIMFEDNVNNDHPLNNLGKVKFSNLCSEILQYSDVSEYTDYDEKDNIGQDISCNLGSLNIVNVMKQKDIENTVRYSIKALTKVADKTDIKNAPAVRKANNEMHSVGLGAMNLHGYLAQNGIAYESQDAIEFVDAFFRTVNYWTIMESTDIARERGETFKGFMGSDYQTGKYFERYREEDFEVKSEKVKALFEGVHIPTEEDWIKLSEKVKQDGMYHSYLSAIAPTGSISYVQSATASVMPITDRVEERTYGDSRTFYPMPGIGPKTWFLYKEAYDMDMFKVVDLIATIQKHVHQGISFTLFVKDDVDTRKLSRIYLYAHHKGIKTLYYTRQKDQSQAECLSCAV